MKQKKTVKVAKIGKSPNSSKESQGEVNLIELFLPYSFTIISLCVSLVCYHLTTKITLKCVVIF
jgi:hypothetical protein